ncbi:hypothetical protein Leryth_010371 [Lithospermum erythrorhizon]|nr:hypothetical protein Leryth_010371 [Lithospermum erythrorhizon]
MRSNNKQKELIRSHINASNHFTIVTANQIHHYLRFAVSLFKLAHISHSLGNLQNCNPDYPLDMRLLITKVKGDLEE